MISSPIESEAPPAVFHPEKVLAALGNPLRWQMFRMLAAGSPMHAAEVAKEFGREFDGISKHLRILRSAGLLQSRSASDRRVTQYFVPAELRKTPGEIELGFCLLRVREARPEPPGEPLQESPEEEFEDELVEEEPVQGFGEMLVKNTALGSGREG